MENLPRGLRPFGRGLDLLDLVFAVAGGVALVALGAVTIISVFWRYVLNNPIFGIEDISSLCLSVVVATSVAYGARKGAHVSVDVVTMVGGKMLVRWTDAIARGLGCAMCAVAAYALFSKGSCGLPCGAITANLGIVHTPFYYVLGVALAGYAVTLAFELAVGLTEPGRGNDGREATG